LCRIAVGRQRILHCVRYCIWATRRCRFRQRNPRYPGTQTNAGAGRSRDSRCFGYWFPRRRTAYEEVEEVSVTTAWLVAECTLKSCADYVCDLNSQRLCGGSPSI